MVDKHTLSLALHLASLSVRGSFKIMPAPSILWCVVWWMSLPLLLAPPLHAVLTVHGSLFDPIA